MMQGSLYTSWFLYSDRLNFTKEVFFRDLHELAIAEVTTYDVGLSYHITNS